MREVALVSFDGAPQMSMTLLAEQIVRVLPDWKVHRFKTAKTGLTTQLPPRMPVISLVDELLAPVLKTIKYSRPERVINLMAGDWVEKTWPEQMAYFGMLMRLRKINVPYVHAFTNGYGHDEVEKSARQFLSPWFFRQVKDSMYYMPLALEPGFFPGKNDPDRLMVPMNRVGMYWKRSQEHHDATKKYLTWARTKGYKPLQLFFHLPGLGEGLKRLGSTPVWDPDVYEWLPCPHHRDAYKASAAATGMFLSMSVAETFGLMYLELLSAGAVGVFAKYPWIDELLPGYPYTVPAPNVVEQMIWIRSNWDEAKQTVWTYWDKIKGRFAEESFAGRLEDLLSGPTYGLP